MFPGVMLVQEIIDKERFDKERFNMRLFDKFRGKPLALATPDDDPDAKRLRAAQQGGDYESVASFLYGLTDYDAREFYIRELTEWPGRPPFFDRWVQAMPECSDAWLLRGAHSIHWAWEARTSTRAAQVSQDAWPIFAERLKGAWSDLDHASKLNAADPGPFAEKINCAIGLQLKKPVVNDCLKNARRRAPDLWEPHVRSLLYLTKKWHGSHEEMFSFAGKLSSTARVGSGLHTVVAVAHLERWLYAVDFDRDALADTYWEQPAVVTEIIRAYRQSLGASEYTATRASRWMRNFFAFALSQVQAFNEAATEFRHIGNRPPDWPWSVVGTGDALETFSQFRDHANKYAT